MINASAYMNMRMNGRGGHTPETLPRFQNKKFNNKGTGYVCRHCNSHLNSLSNKDVLENNECPFCHTKGSIVTATMREVVKMDRRTVEERGQLINEIINTLKINPRMSNIELSRKVGVSTQLIGYYLRKNGYGKEWRSHIRLNNSFIGLDEFESAVSPSSGNHPQKEEVIDPQPQLQSTPRDPELEKYIEVSEFFSKLNSLPIDKKIDVMNVIRLFDKIRGIDNINPIFG